MAATEAWVSSWSVKGDPLSIADFSASKKRFLFVATAMSCVFTALLFFTRQGTVFIGMLFFILAEIGYRGAQVFYDGLLPELGDQDELADISGKGWAIGSAGGIVCLLIILPMLLLFDGPLTVRLTFPVAALFFALSAMPLFLHVRERAVPQTLPAGENYLTVGFKRLWRTIREASRYKQAVRFVIASIVFNGGVIAAMDFAAILGGTLFGIQQQGLIILVILVQVTNVLGAWVFGSLVQRASAKGSLLVAIGLMALAVLLIYITPNATMFFMVASLAGLAMAGVQSVSRTIVGLISPVAKSAEFYGFYSVAGRTSSFLGPLVYGWVAADFAHRYMLTHGMDPIAADKAGLRAGLFVMAGLMIVGMLILLLMDEKAAIAAAYEESEITMS